LDEQTSDQFQRRYIYFHTAKLVDICYGAIATSNQKFDESVIPTFIECINKLNNGADMIQMTSNMLAEQNDND
jgi:hypothetical protein